ncbi:hypothetical protein NHX12_008681 [Muraenolepis orangiensis]|uniref:USP domain-containing protein n=1 Tax=Muraenolepis orangiensis TaxID=630683 RepID=A0A9Q0DQD3_9TELE|nr:hypothetical protein NHX12_008681 [Muraenolepis orangiensis]
MSDLCQSNNFGVPTVHRRSGLTESKTSSPPPPLQPRLLHLRPATNPRGGRRAGAGCGGFVSPSYSSLNIATPSTVAQIGQDKDQMDPETALSTPSTDEGFWESPLQKDGDADERLVQVEMTSGGLNVDLHIENFLKDETLSSVPQSTEDELGVLGGFVAIRESRQSDNMFHKMSVLESFKSTVALQDPEFEDYSQKDAHEFLISVLKQVRTPSSLLWSAALDTPGRSYTCPVEAHLLFHMLNTRTCKRCGGQSMSMEAFTNLSLDLEPGDSVSQALDRYLTETPVECDCQCGAKTSGVQLCFLNLPNVLILHLKRFRFNPDWSLEKGKYTLVSVLSHIGDSPVSGHYVSDGSFQGKGDTPPDQWLSYDDETVSWTSGRKVCEQRQCTAYLLFYERQVGG